MKSGTQYWLVKSEEADYPLACLKRDRVTQWTGVRNYQARNFLMNMEVGDTLLFYHSNGNPSAVVGLARVCRNAYPDETQFDKRSPYFEPAATKDKPRWFAPDVEFVESFARPVALEELKTVKGLEKLPLLQKGSRLSVHPVTAREFEIITRLVSSKKS